MISKAVSVKIGIKRIHGFFPVTTASGYYTLIRKVSLRDDPVIGGVSIKNSSWMVLSKSEAERFDGLFDGILGRDILSSLVIHLDYPNGLYSLMGENATKQRFECLERYDSIAMSKKAVISIGIDDKSRKFLVDSGGSYTMILCKNAPKMLWSSKSILKEMAIGKASDECYTVGLIPLIKFGVVSLSNIATKIRREPLSSYYGMIGQYFLEEGDFFIDFISKKLLFQIRDNYLLSRESGSVINLEFVVQSKESAVDTVGFIRVLSIFPSNQLAIDYSLQSNDKILKINGEPLVVNSHQPDELDISEYLYCVVLQRFESLEILRSNCLLTIYNNRRGEKINGK